MVKIRPVAVMEMIDDGESDYKIIGVPADDKRWEDTKDLKDLNSHKIREIQHFFETYKELRGHKAIVKINGTKGKNEAIKAIKKSIRLYKEKFGGKK